MCAVSMIGDHYLHQFSRPSSPAYPLVINQPPTISRREFDDLKKVVEEMKELLRRAKEYDERNGEPDCEIDEKMALLRKVADAVGVSLDDVIGKEQVMARKPVKKMRVAKRGPDKPVRAVSVSKKAAGRAKERSR